MHLSDSFTYTAHTGCVNTKDNSLDSIDAAVQYGADIVEIDLNFTADGQPVLSHDDPVGGEVSIDEAFEKISKCDGLKVNVDVKNTTNLRAVVNAAEKYGITANNVSAVLSRTRTKLREHLKKEGFEI